MKIVRGFALGFLALSLTALILTPGGAFATTDARSATVGDFLASYAKVLKIELPANAGADQLVAALKATGVKLDGTVDTSKSLTQGDVVRIGKANGLRLTTQHPEAAFSSAEIDQFFTSYGFSLVPAASLGNRFNDHTAADTTTSQSGNTPGANKGKKKGHFSPTEPL